MLDNGRPRDIQVFSSEAAVTGVVPRPALPTNTFFNRFGTQRIAGRITVIVIDAVLLSIAGQSQARAYALRAIAQMETGNPMAIYALCPDPRVVQDYTSDPQQALRSLSAFFPIQPPPSYVFGQGKVTAVLRGLGTIATHLGTAPGRKAIIWLSPGFEAPALIKGEPNISLTYDETAKALNDSNTALYQVDPAGVGRNMLAAAMMEKFTGLTGGHVSYQGNRVDGAILRAATDSQSTYEMGFYLSDADFDGTFHQLDVRIPGHSHYELGFRHGYTASTGSPANEPRNSDLTTEVLDPGEVSAIGIEAVLKVLPGEIRIPSLKGARSARSLELSLVVDPLTVALSADETRSIEQMLIETDASGRELVKVHEDLQLTWPRGHPIARYTKTIELRNEATMLLLVIRDKSTGRIGSLKMSLAGVH